MFKSLALGSMSVASAPASKSSAASSYDSSSKSDKWKNDLSEMNLEINKLTRYEISCMKDGSEGQGWAEFGISVLNFFGGDVDYPDHWFLIAETKPQNFIKDILSSFLQLGLFFSYLFQELKHVDTTPKNKKEVKKVDINEYLDKILKEVILILENKEKNPCKFLHEIYGKEIMEDMVKKLKDMKNIKNIKNIKDINEDFLKNLDLEKYTKVYYFLIEKGGNGKTVKYYKNVNEILDEESKNYNNNECYLKEYYYMNNKTTIKDLKDYVQTLSDSYNLIDDNCQVFVRNILEHYNLE